MRILIVDCGCSHMVMKLARALESVSAAIETAKPAFNKFGDAVLQARADEPGYFEGPGSWCTETINLRCEAFSLGAPHVQPPVCGTGLVGT